jgi:hypothetical protein
MLTWIRTRQTIQPSRANNCIGLVELRILTTPYDATSQFFTDRSDAIKCAAKMGDGGVIYAIQYNGKADYTKDPTKEYPSKIKPPPLHNEGNHATWNQLLATSPDGGYWEWLGADGRTGQPFYKGAKTRNVVHAEYLPSTYDNTIYGVRWVKDHNWEPDWAKDVPLKPTGPKGKWSVGSLPGVPAFILFAFSTNRVQHEKH